MKTLGFMVYYYAKDHDPFDSKTVSEFKSRCPDGYHVKKDYYEVISNKDPKHGKWFFYFYCKDGAEVNHYKIASFISAAESSIGVLFEENSAWSYFSKEREKIKDLYFKDSLSILEKAKISLLEKEIKSCEGILEYRQRILGEEYDEVWDNIAGFCSLVSVNSKNYIYSFFDSENIRNRLTVFYSFPDEFYQVFNFDTCLYYVMNYCDENNIAVSENLFELIQQKINKKDEKKSFGTMAFLLIEEIKGKRLTSNHSPIATSSASSQTRTLNFCPKCGAKINASDSFCPTCGCKIE